MVRCRDMLVRPSTAAHAPINRVGQQDDDRHAQQYVGGDGEKHRHGEELDSQDQEVNGGGCELDLDGYRFVVVPDWMPTPGSSGKEHRASPRGAPHIPGDEGPDIRVNRLAGAGFPFRGRLRVATSS
jgi:hypothetical protein